MSKRTKKIDFDKHYDYEGKLLDENIPFSALEAYKKLRTNLIFSSGGNKTPIFAITSYASKAGKSITSANIAMSFSMIGKKVLLIDADMRLPSIHKIFKYKAPEKGLSTLLATADDIDGYILTCPKYENLYILDAGTIPPNPSELLSLSSVEKFFAQASEKFDIVIVDMPPVGVVTDAVLIAPYITGYIVLAQSGFTKKGELQDVISTLEKNGGKISGIVLNGISMKSHGYGYKGRKYGYKYGYDYGYGYGSSKAAVKSKNTDEKNA